MTPHRRSLRDCLLLDLPKHGDPRGNLTFVEGARHVPFDIRRIFYIYDVPTEESRGAHAHRTLQQFLICVSGTFEVALDDGRERSRVALNRPWKGLLVPPMIWAAEENFAPGTVCLVLTSDVYRDDDYIRDYAQFLSLAQA
jgi:dTDP-4-dehydrorhamnose 3,5-epimerase-like enzyme